MKGITKGLGVLGNIADDLFTSKEEKMRIDLEFYEVDAELAKGQLDINKEEAKHKSIFVSGWRPFIGWVCGFSFAYKFLLYPFIQFLSVVFEWAEVDKLPHLDMGEMTPVLLGMLGLGGLRSYEKFKGVSSDAIKPKKKRKLFKRRNR